MSPILKEYLNKRVVIIKVDGQCLIASLNGFDKNTNLFISDVFNRIDKEFICKAQLLRGSEIALVGLIDSENDDSLAPIDEEGVPKLKDTRNIIENEHVIWGKVYDSKKNSYNSDNNNVYRNT
ncbi:Lsm8p [Saccharomyces cerevisiae x Saccharomyces kudriavzevii VIN7]|uniref:LSM2-LSM8 complex subunit LSM8 n=1 Tax=Saccharomyces cerevisiae x Saccharomyces kudriavzevii (strain VIN7) TaxID=1095631 RepID=H0GWZ1_SACCK|nr:Lsm8p [Saccharomyces cerevisiae x Saccharomyces kudriavzevii VIN7]